MNGNNNQTGFEKALSIIEEANRNRPIISCCCPSNNNPNGPTGPTERLFKSSNSIIIDSS